MKSTVAILVLFTAALLGGANADCPANSEFTLSSTCDYVCGKPCGLNTAEYRNICLCIDGYLMNPNTNQCILERECTANVPDNTPTLRNANGFQFACFS